MRFFKHFFLLLVTFLIVSTPALAMEVSKIDFIDGTLYKEQKAKLINLDENGEIRLYISSEGEVEFIDKKNNATLKLFHNITNPLLVYKLETKKPTGILYALLDRSVKHNMKTDHFVLVGCIGKEKSYSIITDLELLKENGWLSEGLQLRIEDKQLVIEGLVRSKASPDNQVQPFLMDYDPNTKLTGFTNLRAQQEAEDLPKKLKGSNEFMLAGFKPGDNIKEVSKKYGEKFAVKEKVVEMEENQAEQLEAGLENEETVLAEALEDEEQKLISHVYNKNLEFEFAKEDGTIWAIYTTAKNFETARGLKVGMSLQDLTTIYGHNYKRIRAPKATIHYVYAMKRHNPEVSKEDLYQIGFTVNAKEKIIAIFVDQFEKNL